LSAYRTTTRRATGYRGIDEHTAEGPYIPSQAEIDLWGPDIGKQVDQSMRRENERKRKAKETLSRGSGGHRENRSQQPEPGYMGSYDNGTFSKTWINDLD